MADRRGPENGYDFGAKRQYRRIVWSEMRRFCKLIGVPVADQHALLMPSIEADEIAVALNAGFREPNLHIVDRNPAIVATIKRQYRLVNTYGVPITEAAKRIAKSGIRLRVANLDFCNQLSVPHVRNLDAFAQSGCLTDLSSVAVTMLRGREGRDVTDVIKSFPVAAVSTLRSILPNSGRGLLDSDVARICYTGLSLRGAVTIDRTHSPIMRDGSIARYEVYKSGTQTMLFGVYWLRPCRSN